MKYALILFLFALASCVSQDRQAEEPAKKITEGETLFKSQCASCHKPDKEFVAPALKGVAERWESKALLYSFVRRPQEVIATSQYAKDLQNKYGSLMTSFPQLTDTQIQAVLDYCNNYNSVADQN
jgi:mono/diheme cytochrome c family protein